MSSEPMQLIDDMLSLLNEEHSNCDDLNKDNQITHWLKSQLKNMIFELEAIKMDMESGVSLKEIGFFTKEDLFERLEEYKTQISNLKSALRNLKEIA
jgi:hypothetical protein